MFLGQSALIFAFGRLSRPQSLASSHRAWSWWARAWPVSDAGTAANKRRLQGNGARTATAPAPQYEQRPQQLQLGQVVDLIDPYAYLADALQARPYLAQEQAHWRAVTQGWQPLVRTLAGELRQHVAGSMQVRRWWRRGTGCCCWHVCGHVAV